MPWGVAAAAIAAGGAAYSANKQANAAEAAGRRSAGAADAATAEQRREYDLTRQDQMPWLNTGKAALSKLAGLYGLNDSYGADNFAGSPGTSGGDNHGQYNQFFQSPDYQFALNQGLQGLDRSAAARGSLFSGGHNADVLQYAEGLASQNFNNYANRLSGLAGIGQTTATNLGQLGANTASNIGNIGMQSAAAQNASSYDKTNAWTNFGNQLVGLAGQYFGSRGNAVAPNGISNGGSFISGNALTGGQFAGNVQNPNTVGWPGMNSAWGQV